MSWGWIAVDLDGTLAEYNGWGDGGIGAPIPEMVERVKGWLKGAKDVRIFTARAALVEVVTQMGVTDNEHEVKKQIALIEAWCQEHLGQVLPITATKDYGMVMLYDDRAVTVERNTGRLLAPEQL